MTDTNDTDDMTAEEGRRSAMGMPFGFATGLAGLRLARQYAVYRETGYSDGPWDSPYDIPDEVIFPDGVPELP